MGRSYVKDLSQLAATYDWARTRSVPQLSDAVAEGLHSPLLVIGSGGSYSGAHAIARLHELHAGMLARAVTPLEAIQAPDYVDRPGVVLLSAGGRNPDVLISFESVLRREPRTLTVITSSLNSPLGRVAASVRSVNLVVLESAAGRDGYLATNSLLALVVACARAYSLAARGLDDLPLTLEALMGESQAVLSDRLRAETAALWRRQSLLVLHSTAVSAGAIDLESKFVEAGLGSVQLCDFRNFAHGRHQWLARFAQSTAVLGFQTESDHKLAEATLKHIRQVPTARIQVSSIPTHAIIASIVYALTLTGLAGIAKGIDPGRPHVPTFGRRLYHSKSLRTAAPSLPRSPLQAAATRKIRALGMIPTDSSLRHWEYLATEFVKNLQLASFAGIVLDYDGTLCDRSDRFSGVSKEVVPHIRRIVAAGLPLGVATGRGGSVLSALREILPKSSWTRVQVGRYNGAVTGSLADERELEVPMNAEVEGIAIALKADESLASIAKLDFRPFQVTAVPRNGHKEQVWEAISRVVALTAARALTVVRSSHSIDVLAPGVSKRNVVDALRADNGLTASEAVLCIGDRGRWPGNDFELLDQPLSLSVDDVSEKTDRCWNLAPPGINNTQALDFYLRSAKIRRGYLQIRGLF